MKFRIVRHSRVLRNGDIETWFEVRQKEWLFWLTVQRWEGCYDGGNWAVCRFDTYDAAEGYIAAECERLRRVKAAKASVKRKKIVSEIICAGDV